MKCFRWPSSNHHWHNVTLGLPTLFFAIKKKILPRLNKSKNFVSGVTLNIQVNISIQC